MTARTRAAPQPQQRRRDRSRTRVRLLIYSIAFGFLAKKNLYERLLPNGRAVVVAKKDRPVFAAVDNANDSLQAKHGKLFKIYERMTEGQSEPLLKGPETVLFGPDGTMYVATAESKLVKLSDFEDGEDSASISAKATEMVDLGVGIPLGGRITGKTLYIADAVLGLTRVVNFQDRKSKVELLATQVMDNGEWTPILYADDVMIGPKSGLIYFSDASNVAPDRIGPRKWDIVYASKIEYARGLPTGRLLQYNPATHEVTVLAKGIHFANGIAVDKDETFLMISETFQGRSLKYHLQGEKKGSLEVMVDQYTGYVDGADCDWSSGLCYVPIFFAEDKTMHLLSKLPSPFDAWLRTFIMTLPKSLAPDVTPYGGIYEVFPGDATSPAKITKLFQDPRGQDIHSITGVTVHNNKLYLGSIRNDFIGVYDLR